MGGLRLKGFHAKSFSLTVRGDMNRSDNESSVVSFAKASTVHCAILKWQRWLFLLLFDERNGFSWTRHNQKQLCDLSACKLFDFVSGINFDCLLLKSRSVIVTIEKYYDANPSLDENAKTMLYE